MVNGFRIIVLKNNVHISATGKLLGDQNHTCTHFSRFFFQLYLTFHKRFVFIIIRICFGLEIPSGDSVYYKSAGKIFQLRYSSGDVENVSQRTVISGENDWEKVTITFDSTDIEGMVRVGLRQMASSSLQDLFFFND
jgi:hypothetical protein